jgi:tripartite-type tricarboxylate transporter receptor subunit TctC
MAMRKSTESDGRSVSFLFHGRGCPGRIALRLGRVLLISLSLFVFSSLPGHQAGAASSDASFFKGNTITFIVPSKAGGGVDTYARMIGPYLAEYTGASVVVLNKPGGQSLIGMNDLYVAKPNGLTIGTAYGEGPIGFQIAGAPGVRYDLAKMTWLAGITPDPNTLIVRAPVKEIQTWKDVLNNKKGYKFGSAGGGPYVCGLVLEKALNSKFNMVLGFGGSTEVKASLRRNETDMYCNTLASSYTDIKNGYERALLTVTTKKNKDFPNVATIKDTQGTISPDNYQMLETYSKIYQLARPIMAPPGMKGERLNFLRDALKKVLTNDDFIAKAAKAHRPVDYISGEEAEKDIREVLNPPKELKDILKKGFATHK